MAIYDKSGYELNATYDLSGIDLTEAYNIDGDLIFTQEPIEYSIENVAKYFKTQTLAVADAINGLSSDWQSFIFVTDSHQSNYWHSAPIVMYLLANTDARYFFHGGDCIAGAWSETDYMRYFAPMIENGFTSMIYPVIGNHELYLYNGATYSDLSVIYTSFLQKPHLHGHPDEYYYYFDNTAKKTRYLFLNTSDTTGNQVTQAQLNWIYETVQLPGTDWSLVIVGHIDIDATNFTGQWKSNQATAVTNALSTCNGSIVGYFCGHEHIDQLRLVNNKFFQCICLCDVFENDNYFNVDNYPVRTAGTATEQVVTVVSFNTTTGGVVTRRIGAGDEYAWNYKTLQEVTS